jgi:lipopolysaccharide export system permease protein
MKIIDRYLLTEYLRNFLLVAVAFVFLFLLIDFFEKIRMFLSNHATVSQMLSYTFFRLPLAFAQLLPAVVLLSSLLTFGNLSRHNEIIAIKTNGIHIFRLAVSTFIIAALTSAAIFILNEWVNPYAFAKSEHIRLIEIQKRPALGSFSQGQIWYRGQKGIYNFRLFDARSDSLQGISIYYLDNNMNLSMRLDAKSGKWKDGRWIFSNVLISRFDKDAFPVLSRIKKHIPDIPETPADFKLVQKNAEEMGYFELRRYITRLQSEGYDATQYYVDLYGKISFPLVSIILAVIGFSFSLHSERSGGIFAGIGAGLIIGFSYWIVFAFGISLGRAGTLPSVLAAWMANILFGAASVFMLFRVRS